MRPCTSGSSFHSFRRRSNMHCWKQYWWFPQRGTADSSCYLSSLAKVLPPCHHISIDRPFLERRVVKVKSKGGYVGIHIHSQIFLRKDSHVLGIASCTGKI